VLGVQRAWSRSNSLLVCICSTMQWKLVGKVCCHMTSPLCLLSSISAMQDRAPGGRKTRLSISKSAEPGLAAAAASAPSTPSPGEALAGQPKSAARAAMAAAQRLTLAWAQRAAWGWTAARRTCQGSCSHL